MSEEIYEITKDADGVDNCRKHEYVECFDADDYCSWGERND